MNTAERNPAASPTRRIGLVALPIVVFGFIAAMFAFSLKSGDPSKLPSVLIGKPAPPIEVAALDGLLGRDGRPFPVFRSADLGGGRPALINFWASWCVPCVQEHPMLIEVARATGIAIHGINYKDQPAAARRFLGLHGNPYASVGVDAQGRAAIEWGVYGMPETFLVDAAGIVVYKHVGPITPETLRTRVLPAIEAAKAKGGAAKPAG